MADEKGFAKGGHKISLDNRQKLNITGVTDVLSFDEESIIADTEMGILMIKGTELHIIKINLDDGILSVEGEVEQLEYTEEGNFAKGKGSLLSRIFK